MLWVDDRTSGWTAFKLENDDIRNVNRYATEMNVMGYLEWVQKMPVRERIAYATRLMGFGTEYAEREHLETVQSQGAECEAAVAALEIGEDHRIRSFREKHFFEALEEMDEPQLVEAERFSFIFYALNDNWKKFPTLQPGSSE